MTIHHTYVLAVSYGLLDVIGASIDRIGIANLDSIDS
jgi:hypothetical protein